MIKRGCDWSIMSVYFVTMANTGANINIWKRENGLMREIWWPVFRQLWAHSGGQSCGRKWELKPWKVTCWHLVFSILHLIAFIHLEFQIPRAIAGDKQRRRKENRHMKLILRQHCFQHPRRRKTACLLIHKVSAERRIRLHYHHPRRTEHYVSD